MEHDGIRNDGHDTGTGHAELHVNEAYPLAHVFVGHPLPATDDPGSNQSSSKLYNDEVLVGPQQVFPGYPENAVLQSFIPVSIIELTPASSSTADIARMGNQQPPAARDLCATNSPIKNSHCEVYRDGKLLNLQQVLGNTHTHHIPSPTASRDTPSSFAPRSISHALAATNDIMACSIFKVYRDGALVHDDDVEAPTDNLPEQHLEVDAPATIQNALKVEDLPTIRTTTGTCPSTSTLATRAYEPPPQNPLRKYLDRVSVQTAMIMSEDQEPGAIAEAGVQITVTRNALAGDGEILEELANSSKSLRQLGPDKSPVCYDSGPGGNTSALPSATFSLPAWPVGAPTVANSHSDDIADKDIFPSIVSSPNDAAEECLDSPKASVFERAQPYKEPTAAPSTQHITPTSIPNTSPKDPSSAFNKYPLPSSSVPAWPPMQLNNLTDLPVSEPDHKSTSPTPSNTSEDPVSSLIFSRDILLFTSGALLMGYPFQFIITPLTLALLVIRPFILSILLERVEDMAEWFREGYAVKRPRIHRYDLPFLMLRNGTAILWWGLYCLGALAQEWASVQIEEEEEEEQGHAVVHWVPHPLLLASSIIMAVAWIMTFLEKKITMLVLAVVFGLVWDNPELVATALGRRAKMLSLIKEDAMQLDIAEESKEFIGDNANKATGNRTKGASSEKMPTVKLRMHSTNDSSPEETEADRRAEIQKDIEEADVSMARLLHAPLGLNVLTKRVAPADRLT